MSFAPSPPPLPVISIAPYFTDKGEHATLYKISNKVSIMYKKIYKKGSTSHQSKWEFLSSKRYKGFRFNLCKDPYTAWSNCTQTRLTWEDAESWVNCSRRTMRVLVARAS